MQLDQDNGDGLLSRSDMEIEIARLVLGVTRRREAAGSSEAADPEFTRWFEAAALDLVNRVAPDLRPFVLSRLQQIAESNAGLQISELEIDHTTLSFSPAAPGEEIPPEP